MILSYKIPLLYSITVQSLLIALLLPPSVSSSSSSTVSSGTTPSILEEIRYANLPPTVFAPGGRLHSVERVARESSDVNDITSPLWVALKCRERDSNIDDDNDDASNECVVLVGIRPHSPHLYEGIDDDNDKTTPLASTTTPSSPTITATPPTPLLLHPSSSSTTATILHPHLLTAVGGHAADAAVLQNRIQRTALRVWQADGTARGVTSGLVARRLADVAQIGTHVAKGGDGSVGRMLACAVLVIGADIITPDDNGTCHELQDGIRRQLTIWRVDPTGQFWNCDAGSVGRGAGAVDANLLRRVAKWKLGGTGGSSSCRGDGDSLMERTVAELGNSDVKDYLSTLSHDDALRIGVDCVLETLGWSESEDESRRGTEVFWNRLRAFILRANGGDEGPECLYGDELRRRFKN